MEVFSLCYLKDISIFDVLKLNKGIILPIILIAALIYADSSKLFHHHSECSKTKQECRLCLISSQILLFIIDTDDFPVPPALNDLFVLTEHVLILSANSKKLDFPRAPPVM